MRLHWEAFPLGSDSHGSPIDNSPLSAHAFAVWKDSGDGKGRLSFTFFFSFFILPFCCCGRSWDFFMVVFSLTFFYIVLAFIFSCLSVANHLSIFCFSPYFLLLPFRISQTGDSNRLTLGEQPEGMVLNHSATRRTNWGILLVSRELTTLGHRTQ